MKPPFACGFRFDLLGVSPKEPRRDSAQYITAQQGVGQTVATGCEFGTTLESPEKLALRSHVVHRNFIGQNVRSCCFLLDVLEICSNEKLSQVLYPKSKVSIMYFSHVPADVIGFFSVFKRFPNVFCWFFFCLKKVIHWEPSALMQDVVLLVGLFHQSEWASPTDRSGPDVSYRMRGGGWLRAVGIGVPRKHWRWRMTVCWDHFSKEEPMCLCCLN